MLLKRQNFNRSMGIEDPKLRLFVLLLINLIVILVFRNWVLNNEAFVWLLNGLPSWIDMESFDSIFQDYVKSGFCSYLLWSFLPFIGSFFLVSLITSVKRGMKEEGWFKFKKEKEEDK